MNPRQEGRRTQNKDYLKNENVPKNIDNFKNKWNSIWKFKKNSKMKMTQRMKTTLNHMARAYLTVVILVFSFIYFSNRRTVLIKTSTKFVHSCVRLREVNILMETMKIKNSQKLKILWDSIRTPKIPYYSLESL